MAHSTGVNSGPGLSSCLAHVHIVPSDGAGAAINRHLPLHHQRVVSDLSGAQVIGWAWAEGLQKSYIRNTGTDQEPAQDKTSTDLSNI